MERRARGESRGRGCRWTPGGGVVRGVWAAAFVLPLAAPLQSVPGAATPVRAQELQVIGTIEEGDGPVLGGVADLVFLPDGRVVLLDDQAKQLHWYAPDGRFLRTVSRAGEGPGEIGGANELALDGLGRISVLDYGNLRISVWDSEGEFVGGVPLRDVLPPGGYPVGLKGGDGRLWVKSTSFDVPPRNRITSLTLDFAHESPRITVNPEIEWEGDEPSCTFCDWAVRDGRLALVVGDTLYRVEEWADGAATGRRWERRDLPAAPLSAEEIADRRERMGARRAAEGGRGAPDVDRWHHRLTRGRIAWDPAGPLWLAPTRPAESPPILDLFGADGALRRSIPLDHPLLRMAAGDGRIAIVSEDAVGAPRVILYGVRR